MMSKNFVKVSFIGSILLLISGSVMLSISVSFFADKSREEAKNKLVLPSPEIHEVILSKKKTEDILAILKTDVKSYNGSNISINYKRNEIFISGKTKDDYGKFTDAINKLNFLASPFRVEIRSLCLGKGKCSGKEFYKFSGQLVKKQISWN